MSEFLKSGTYFREDSALKATHVKKKIRVVFAIHRHETVFPQNSGDGTRQAVLDVPEHSTAKVDIVFHEPHASITRPTFLVIITHYVLIVRVRMLSEVTLNEISSFLGSEPTGKSRHQMMNDSSHYYLADLKKVWTRSM